MATLEILEYPSPILRMKAMKVERVDAELRNFMNDMLETMYASNGIGLAATQVGDLRRVLVLDVSQREGEKEPMFFVNPEIIWKSAENNTYTEGCLSFPQQFAEVVRPKMVKISYLDYHGSHQEIDADELLATCVQHEIDHLDGKVFVDYVPRVKRDVILRKLKKKQRLSTS